MQVNMDAGWGIHWCAVNRERHRSRSKQVSGSVSHVATGIGVVSSGLLDVLIGGTPYQTERTAYHISLTKHEEGRDRRLLVL